jgi:hypothetical protein
MGKWVVKTLDDELHVIETLGFVPSADQVKYKEVYPAPAEASNNDGKFIEVVNAKDKDGNDIPDKFEAKLKESEKEAEKQEREGKELEEKQKQQQEKQQSDARLEKLKSVKLDGVDSLIKDVLLDLIKEVAFLKGDRSNGGGKK